MPINLMYIEGQMNFCLFIFSNFTNLLIELDQLTVGRGHPKDGICFFVIVGSSFKNVGHRYSKVKAENNIVC